MTKNTLLKIIIAALLALFLISCSGNDYTNAIPSDCTALVSIDMERTGNVDGKFTKEMLHTDDANSTGIDFGEKVYLFTTNSGFFGLCAKTGSEDGIKGWLGKLDKQGLCGKLTEKRNMTVTTVNGNWVMAFNSDAVVIVGPVLATQQAEAYRTVAGYLKQEDNGCQLFKECADDDSPFSFCARANALPDFMSAMLTLGTPKGTDPSQVIFSASAKEIKDDCMFLEGSPLSTNKSINDAIDKAARKFRRINGNYISSTSADALCSVMTNCKGTDLATMLHASEAMGSLLTGINTTIDIDKVLESTDGDILISADALSAEKSYPSMCLKLKNTAFKEDIPYWQKSCPSGCSISATSTDAYNLTTGSSRFNFGITPANDFYGYPAKSDAPNALPVIKDALPQTLRTYIKDQNFCIIINTSKIADITAGSPALAALANLLTANCKHVIYSQKTK